jgi:hypothetical protein
MFSTTFFSFAADGWHLSRMFWLYWVVTVPLTMVVVFCWWKFLGGSFENIRAKRLGIYATRK